MINEEQLKTQPKITVGIMDRDREVTGHLNGNFSGDRFGPVSGRFVARVAGERIVLKDSTGHEITRSPSIRLMGQGGTTFSLFNVTIGKRFHWERTEEQTFPGDLIFETRKEQTIAVINEIPLEDYLISVIPSEMSGSAPFEFLKAHAMLSRSWLLAGMDRRKTIKETPMPATKTLKEEDEVVRWYDREDHDLFDVCADDHCQRYQGMTKVISKQAKEAVRDTCGRVIIYQNKICDARYSKACGGVTEEYDAAWEDRQVPYLRSVSDASVLYSPIRTEEEAWRWFLSAPEVYCHTKDERLLETILPDIDRQTKDFFRWEIQYSREELQEILREKSGFDFGALREIVPLVRGPSGRISRLKIVGSKRSIVVGKELEIRRWLSRTHLYSSAFVVKAQAGRFRLLGAGWGHGVGLCQIGAAVMATRGFSAEEILRHYFKGIEIKKIY